MSFASPIFLWYFMPALLLVLFTTPRSWRNPVVAASSLIFYVWGAGSFVFLLLACVAFNYVAGQHVEPGRPESSDLVRRRWLIATIVFDIGILAIFKYATFGQLETSAL